MCRFVTEPHVCIINWFPLLLSAYVRMYVLVVWNISVAQWWSFDSTHCLEHCHTALVFGGSVCVCDWPECNNNCAKQGSSEKVKKGEDEREKEEEILFSGVWCISLRAQCLLSDFNISH